MAKKKKEENKQIVFRRIGGRIVPIAVGGGAIAYGRKVGSEESIARAVGKARGQYVSSNKKVKNHYIDNSRYDKWQKIAGNSSFYNTKLKSLKSLYKKEIANNIPKSRILVNEYGNSSSFGADEYGKYVELGGNSIDEATLLHELGHAKQNKMKTKLEKMRRKNMLESNKYLKDVAAEKWLYKNVWNPSKNYKFNKLDKYRKRFSSFARKKARSYGNWLDQTVILGHEIEAWKFANDMVKTPKGKKRLRKKAFNALRTYSQNPVRKVSKYGLIAAGVGSIGYGLFRKDKKK